MSKPQNVPTEIEIPSLPRDEDGPVFKEPWEAQAFAMALNLHAQGHFTWPEWSARLGAVISAANDAGDSGQGDTYYLHWLTTLEELTLEKGLLTNNDLSKRKDAWDKAANATPHGQSIELPPDA